MPDRLFAELPSYGCKESIYRTGFTLYLSWDYATSRDAPWKEFDGHGPVRTATVSRLSGRTDKAPGERVLNPGGDLLYDFAEACRIARRDGWGWLPGPLHYENTGTESAPQWVAFVKGETSSAESRAFVATSPDANEAIRMVYDHHRSMMSAREYAAKAAEADFQRLKAWCEDDWYYIEVTVTAHKNGIELGRASLWGIESDALDYILDDVVPDLVAEAIETAEQAIQGLCLCEVEAA